MRLLSCLLVVSTACPIVWGQQGPDLFLLSAGIDSYQSPTNKLQGCVNDAVGMAKVFQAQQGKLFGRVDALVLTDATATRNAIVSGLKTLKEKGRPGDWYVVLLSGHGGIERDQWAFLTQDNQKISDAQLLATVDHLASAGKTVVVIVDACQAGQLRHSAATLLHRHADPTRGGIILMVSSMPEQPSAALGNYSAFARAVEEGLDGLADYDHDENITLKELRRFTYGRVQELRLKQRPFPGLAVPAQDSAIDSSLSVSETTILARGKKPLELPRADDGPDVDWPDLLERTWKVASAATLTMPAALFELKLDPFGHYRAALKEGARLVTLGSGTYHIKARTLHLYHPQGVDRLDLVAVSPAKLHFRFQGRDFQASCEPLLAENLLVDVTGRLAVEDPRDAARRDSPHRVHGVKLEAGVGYVIDLQSPDFDTYLRVENSAGVQLAEDDDGGDERNSRLVFTPPRSDEYRLIVTTFRGGSGAYHLHVERKRERAGANK